MQNHQILIELIWDLDILLDEVMVHVKEEIMSVPIVARLLFLSRDEHGCFGRFRILFETQVELE